MKKNLQRRSTLGKDDGIYRLLIENLQEGVWMIDADDCTKFVNHRMAEMLGYAPEEMIGKHLSFFMDEQRAQQSRFYLIRRRKGIKERHDFEFLKKDKTRVYVSLETSPLLDKQGCYSGSLAGVIDITARKLVEESLRKSETKYRSLYESASDAVMLLDEQGFFDCNPATLRMFGLRNVTEIRARHPADLSPPTQPCGTDSLKLSSRHIAAALEKGSQSFEWMHKRLDSGKVFPTEVLLSRMEIDGQPVLQATVRDISAHRQAEEQLIQSEARYRRIITTLTDYIYTVFVENGRAQKTEYGAGCLGVTGYTPEDFAANPLLWFTMVFDPDRPRVQTWADRILQGEKMEPLEHRIVRKDGEIRWMRNTAALHLDRAGVLLSYDGIIQDVTDARNAMSERARAEALTSIIDSVPSAIIVIDEEGRIMQFNRALSGVFGYGDEILGIRVGDCCVAPDKAKIKDGIRECLATGWLKNFEVGIIRNNLSAIPALINASVMKNGHGQDRQIVAIITDITERKQAETALKISAEALAVSNGELEQFVTVASHDIQEPLRAIVSFLQLIMHRFSDKLDQQGQDYIRRVLAAAQRMQLMIRDLLAYASVERQPGEGMLSCCLEGVLANALENLDMAITKSRALITHDPLPEIPGDENQLVRLFQNLIGNAIKFCDRETPTLHIGVTDQGESWLLTFQDNGIGIAAEHIGLLFKVFIHLHARDKYPGSGIGLAICKKIIERHQGKIWVESEPAKGTTFFVLFFKQQRGAL